MQNPFELLTLREIQREELRILVFFRDYCEKSGLKYSLAGGTLLGAVRHSGFIPWDDDVDVFMPRLDYEQLIENADDLGSYGLLVEGPSGTKLDKAAPILKIVDPMIDVSGPEIYGVGHLWIDILPIDGVPDDKDQFSRLQSKMLFYRRLYCVPLTPKGQGYGLFKTIVKDMLRPLFVKVRAERFFAKKMYDLAVSISPDDTNTNACLTWGMYGVGEMFSASGFDSMQKLKFENEEFCCISCWDEYLSGIYGDYLQLPKEEDRHTHGLKAWRVGEANV